MAAMPAVLWLRRDLRLADHPALLDAAQHDGEVLACFVLDPRLIASAGPRRLRYLYGALAEVRQRLDGKLAVVAGRPEQCIPALAGAVDATAVHISGDHTPFGRRRDNAVRAALGAVPLHATGSPYLVSPGRVTKSDGTPYRVFTPFFRAWLQRGWRPPARSGPDSARWIDPTEVPGGTEIPATARDRAVGETAALADWQEFCETSLPRYAAERDRPDRDAGSRMSAHLKFGSIHPRTMAADLAAAVREGRDGPDAYLRQLAFRDFYAAVLHHWPDSAWQNWNRDFDRIEVDVDEAAIASFDRWKSGQTGFPIVDAGMRELAATGFMHNRVRMITASFLVKDLHLPWQWGARWFLHQLTDGDLANNQHGWQWAAGCGTDAAPYFRVFNPALQGAKFDPRGDYVRRWVPELAGVDDVHAPGATRPSTYPQPMLDHASERREALRRYGRLG